MLIFSKMLKNNYAIVFKNLCIQIFIDRIKKIQLCLDISSFTNKMLFYYTIFQSPIIHKKFCYFFFVFLEPLNKIMLLDYFNVQLSNIKLFNSTKLS